MRLLVYELNEVPWRVVDRFTEMYPKSTLSSMLRSSIQLTTKTLDVGELHPWSTWPTVHRGVYNTQHKITFLNQALPEVFPPIWEILAGAGVSVGVCGSLHSYPLPSDHTYSFYIPDTFAQTAETYPSIYEAFQSFNLDQTKRAGGVSASALGLSLKNIIAIYRMLGCGLRPKTLAVIAKQLVREKLNPYFRSVRSIYQSPAAFDIFLHALHKNKPSFATFFTNHVAGMMHRFWKYLFPEEFAYTLMSEYDHFHAHSIIRAMQITDYQLRVLRSFCDKHQYALLIVSSMGQEAIDRGPYNGELRLSYLETLCKAIGYKGNIKQNGAMNPDFAFSFEVEEELVDFRNRVTQLKTKDGVPFFRFKQSELTLNCNLASSYEAIADGYVYKFGETKEDKKPFIHYGITIEKRDVGTGYHQPYGMAAFYHKDLETDTHRTIVPSITLLPTMLSLFGVERAPYMEAPLMSVTEKVRAALEK